MFIFDRFWMKRFYRLDESRIDESLPNPLHSNECSTISKQARTNNPSIEVNTSQQLQLQPEHHKQPEHQPRTLVGDERVAAAESSIDCKALQTGCCRTRRKAWHRSAYYGLRRLRVPYEPVHSVRTHSFGTFISFTFSPSLKFLLFCNSAFYFIFLLYF